MHGMIGFENLRIECLIGVNAEEQRQNQELLIDLKLRQDFSQCILTDDLKDTINYDKLAQLCEQIAKKETHHLIEKLAAQILHTILDEFNIDYAWIKIKKPKALSNAQHAFVELTMEKSWEKS